MDPADRPALGAERLNRFAELLRGHPTRRIPRDALWRAFQQAFPHAPRGAEQRAWYLAALLELEAMQVVRLPSARGGRWDTTLRPHVPVSVDVLPPPAAPRNEAWRRQPWHPSLAWVPQLASLAGEQVAFLQRVQQELLAGGFREPASPRYRSLQLTGNEKRLDHLRRTILFGPGRLSDELLGCQPVAPPVAWESVGRRPRALVFENADAFAVARGVLSDMAEPPYGMIVYGGGAGFEQSVRHLATIGRPVERIHYVGDLDRPGLRTAASASRATESTGLPAVEPAPGVHRSMLDSAIQFGHDTGWPHASPGAAGADDQLVSWLPAAVREEALRVLTAGNRIPEEVLGPREMRSWLFEVDHA